jgi:hypothetical protein
VSSNKKNLWIFIIEGNHLSFIFKRTMKELNGIFPAFEKRVKQLKEICKIDGRYELLQMEYFELISKVPAIEVRDFVFSFFKVAMVLYEEAWSLMTGQLLHRYQQEDVSFRCSEGIESFVTKKLSKSTRHVDGVRLCYCSYDGLLYLHDSKQRVSSSTSFVSLFSHICFAEIYNWGIIAARHSEDRY